MADCPVYALLAENLHVTKVGHHSPNGSLVPSLQSFPPIPFLPRASGGCVPGFTICKGGEEESRSWQSDEKVRS